MPDASPADEPLPGHKPEAEGVAPQTQSQAGTPTETSGVGRRRWWVWLAGSLLALVVLIEGIPWVVTALRTVSTDDAERCG